jgi:outer membrane receptor protein involved in Fe transport
MHKTRKTKAARSTGLALTRLPLAVAIHMACCTAAFAQSDTAATEPGTRELETVSVTAQKREENIQKVPIVVQVLDAQKLQELFVSDFDDYVRYLPTVSYQSVAPGFSQVYMRGVASGGDGNHSGPLPSVGIYLDEQPITTIQGALDVHIYDVARVETLAGPQGTLYGASSQSGTIRIITNKPDPSGFSAGYGVEVNAVGEGGVGFVTEGYANIPLSDNAAVRLVAWDKYDAGYIDNVLGTRTFPTSGITIENTAEAEDDYNDVRTYGARAALQIDLDSGWSFAPTVMGQKQIGDGIFGYDPDVGDLEITHFYPEHSDDRWVQSALTVQGKVGNFDLTYAFAHLSRDVDTESDYNDYAFWYDTLLGYGSYFVNDDGDLINPSQYIQGKDGYSKRSHELRLASPADDRWRVVGGLFWQQQDHEITQRYLVDDLADSLSVTGWPDTIWLTRQTRRDHDEAIFGELSYDITEKLTATGGFRYFRAENSLEGFFGFSEGYSGSTGEAACFDETDFKGAPCKNLDKETTENDWLGRFNLTYQIDDGKMIYGTWSEGYRPGGINRRGTLPPYKADFLTNWEFGWKTTWMDNTFLWNGAVFLEEWEDFQFALLGANGLTEIKNANQAEIRGFETEFTWAATYNFSLSGGMAIYDAELTENYCGFTDDDGNPVTECDAPEAPEGTELPVTAKFKGNLTGRYSFEFHEMNSFFQAALVHEGKRKSDLRQEEQAIIGDLDSYTTLDLSLGFARDNWKLEFFLENATDERAELYKFTQCAEAVCGEQAYTVTNQPRTFGVRFSQEF